MQKRTYLPLIAERMVIAEPGRGLRLAVEVSSGRRRAGHYCGFVQASRRHTVHRGSYRLRRGLDAAQRRET